MLTRSTACPPVEKIAERDTKTEKCTPELINLQRKKQSCICLNQMDCDIAGKKQEKFSWREHSQPAEILERMVRMTENDDRLRA